MRALAQFFALRLRVWFEDRTAWITETSELDTRLDRREG